MEAHQQLEEESLRIALPKVYKRMNEVFATYHIHPYDAEGTVVKKKTGYDLTLTFAGSFSKGAKMDISFEQAKNPDDEVTQFLEQTAADCKQHLITDYFKMIKL